MPVIDVHTGQSYQVMIREGILDELGPLASSLFDIRRALLVSDTRVYRLFGERCLRSLRESGWQAAVSLVRPGERSKSLATAGRLYSEALAAGLDRQCPVIALGGGVVGDLAGFVAATYLRGIPFIQVPTTLLAQVDSSVGGKTGVNHPRGKNLIGAFHQPSLVLSDPASLGTLPRRQLRSGAAEVIKTAIISDEAFFAWLEKNLPGLLHGDTAVQAEAVARSVRFKAEVVQGDERESGSRRLLNFGHTIGHALEAATGYRHFLHGEAVLIGMAAATELSRLQGRLDRDSARRIQALLCRVGLRPIPAGITPEILLEKMRYDKKRRGAELFFVLPTAIGLADHAAPADPGLLLQVLGLLLKGCGSFS
ncbi:MAG TPA: 3-dehydroquinate synthase [Bacillota bacterium]|nr:3-dehydroquinate synthase [Bacillota bacterium]